MPDYAVPAKTAEAELVIKKSRFIARLVPCQSRAEFLLFVGRQKTEFSDARHHCWAYLLGDPAAASNAGMSDDGEPSGTAGKPILNVLQHSGMGDVGIVVIRYFGGVKLGAGGLVRAYSASAQAVLDKTPRQQVAVKLSLSVSLEFSKEQILRHWLTQHDGVLENVSYAQVVSAHIVLPECYREAFTEFALIQGIIVTDVQ
ncbi:MAG: YigZ family protein [Gammaproteobacteria bacterium]|nr:MAG: YigZ family protein [Gammaproteobacteria bacterium]